MRTPPRPLVTSVMLLTIAGVAGAHDTWLLASRGSVPVGGVVTFDMSSGGHFPRNELAILPARVAKSGVQLAGRSLPLDAPRAVRGALQFRATLPVEGVAMTWVTLHPKVLTLAPNLVQEYVEEIGADPAFLADWRRTPGQVWKERYSKHAKSFVRVGSAATRDSSWHRPTGQPYEMVPQQDPTSLVAGSELRVQVLRCGKPLANVAVGTERGGSGHAELVRTDANGMATVRFARAGRWLVNTTYLAYAKNVGALCEQALPADTVTVGYVSQFATMTLDVAAARPAR